jgi:hypothetical protein
MAEPSVDALARQLITQCRREIEAAWAHIEAAKEILRQGRWLLKRWAEQDRIGELRENARLASSARSEAARIGMFVLLEPETRRRSRRPLSSITRADRHIHRRSASG